MVTATPTRSTSASFSPHGPVEQGPGRHPPRALRGRSDEPANDQEATPLVA